MRGLQVSLGHVLQNLLLQRQLRHQPLKPRVLFLQLLQPPGLLELEPAVFLAPSVVRLLADLTLPACLWRVLPLAIATSTCRSTVTISSAVYLRFAFLGSSCPSFYELVSWYKIPRAVHSVGWFVLAK